MGLDDAALRRYGIRILKMGRLFPMEPTIVREFAQGLEEIFVIEEKRPFLEMFAKQVLYGMANAPRIVGKFDEEEKELLPHYGEFESDVIVRALLKRLSRKTRIESAENWLKRLDEIHSRKLPTAVRTAWFCSGCPHNSSTQAPDGSIVSAGIGCHTMAMWMGRNVVMGTHMGAEGRSGSAWRPSPRRSTSSRTWATAPTPTGQPGDPLRGLDRGEHHLQAAAQRAHLDDRRPGHPGRGPGDQHGLRPARQRRKKIIVTTDEPARFNGVQLPGGTEVWHRDRIEEAQRVLAATPGCTVLLHDQECAAELRRARSRGKADEPVEVTVINERVCEGCGDWARSRTACRSSRCRPSSVARPASTSPRATRTSAA